MNVWSANGAKAGVLGYVPPLNKYHVVVGLEPWQHFGIWNKNQPAETNPAQ